MIHSTVFVWLIQIRAQMGLMATQAQLARAMVEPALGSGSEWRAGLA